MDFNCRKSLCVKLCKYIITHDHGIKSSSLHKRKKTIYDYRSAAAGCEFSNFQACAFCGYCLPLNQYHKSLLARLVKIGLIGQKSKLCNNYIGACAEVHAANMVLKQVKSKNTINQLKFCEARRPRTMQYIKACKNCKQTFK